MKYTVETTENGVNETLELNGTIYKKEWLRRENGLLECSQKDFRAQMEADGYRENLLRKSMEYLMDFSRRCGRNERVSWLNHAGADHD